MAFDPVTAQQAAALAHDATGRRLATIPLGGSFQPQAPLQMAALSDSLMGYGEGVPTYIELLSAQKLRFADPDGGTRRVFYYPGQTTATLLANIAAVTGLSSASRPDACLIQGGTNDTIASIPLATTVANITAICAALEKAGIRPVLSTTPPNGGSFQNSASRQPGRLLNLAIRHLASTTKRLLVDPYTALVDPITASYIAAYDSGDNTHPSSVGILAWAQKIVADLAPIIPTGLGLLELVNDANGLISAGRFATGNGLFAGAANANVASALGNTTAPSGWTPSLVADSGFNWQRLTGAAPVGALQMYQNPSAAVSPGDLIRCAVRIRTGQTLTGSNKLVMYLRTYTNGGAETGNFNLLGPVGVAQQISDTISLVYARVPASANRAQLNLLIPAAAGTYDIAQPSIMNLTALGVVA